MVTYFPMIVAAESPVGDVLQQTRTALSNCIPLLFCIAASHSLVISNTA